MKNLLALIMILGSTCISLFSQTNIPAFDVAMVSIKSPGYAQPCDQFTISGTFKNNGTQRINDVLINWQVGDGSVHTYKIEGLDISKSVREDFDHPEQIRVEDTTDFMLKVWVSQPNGETDQKNSNDSLSKIIQVVVEFPERNILIEEATGAWCGWCPRGPIVFRDEVHPQYPNTILVGLHNGDDMAFDDVNMVTSTYISGYPSGLVDRRNPGDLGFGISTNSWTQAISLIDRDFTPVELNVYNYFYPDTYEWQIDVVADFIIDFEGDLRLNCYIVEYNYYNTLNDYPELHDIGNPIIGYPHRHVVREMLGGSWGRAGIIPAKAKKGERYIFSRTIKAKTDRWRMENVHLVGIIQAYHSNTDYRPILNAVEAELSLATGYHTVTAQPDFKIFPNPATQLVNMELNSSNSGPCTVQIFNFAGAMIHEFETRTNGSTQWFQLDCSDWSRGSYIVRVIHEQGNFHKKLILSQ